MAENLNYQARGSKCYNDEPANCTAYGRLYDWSTAMIVCPPDFHLPSGEEWQTLVDFVGGDGIAEKKLWKGKSGKGEDTYG
jgi:uncharacterized protein (TIGR02145 family)